MGEKNGIGDGFWGFLYTTDVNKTALAFPLGFCDPCGASCVGFLGLGHGKRKEGGNWGGRLGYFPIFPKKVGGIGRFGCSELIPWSFPIPEVDPNSIRGLGEEEMGWSWMRPDDPSAHPWNIQRQRLHSSGPGGDPGNSRSSSVEEEIPGFFSRVFAAGKWRQNLGGAEFQRVRSVRLS